MFTEEIFYGMKCDRCRKTYEAGYDYSYMNDKGQLEDQAEEEGWATVGNRHYCPCCYRDMGEDENGETIHQPKDAYPERVWKVRELLTFLFGHPGRMNEKGGWLDIQIDLGTKGELSELSEQMIHRTLQDGKFTTAITEDGRNKHRYYTISIELKTFAPGDRVKVIKYSNYRDAFGKEGEVLKVDIDAVGKYIYAIHVFDDGDPRPHYYTADWIELCSND